MERDVKFGEDASFQGIGTVLPRRLVNRIYEESLSLPPVPPNSTQCTNVDVFIKDALEYYLEALESDKPLRQDLYNDPLRFVDIQTRVILEVMLPLSLIDRLRERCGTPDNSRRSDRDIFIEEALWYYLKRNDIVWK